MSGRKFVGKWALLQNKIEGKTHKPSAAINFACGHCTLRSILFFSFHPLTAFTLSPANEQE
jgi:hypothetical protein